MTRRRTTAGVVLGERRRWGPLSTGVPEVDAIIDGCKFRNIPFDCCGHLFDEIRTIREFRELAEEARTNNASPPLPNLDNLDHISRMPDDILNFIISHLTMREAAATSVLSPRWRNLWTTSLSCLNFDVPNMLGHDYPNVIFDKKPQDYIARKRSKFTKWVNRVIAHFFCQGQASSRLDALRVSFVLNSDSTPDIDRWITSAVARGATEIHLDFHHEKFSWYTHDYRKFYVFPAQQVASAIRYLHLKSCKLHLPPDFTGFTSLVSLSLYDVHVNKTFMENTILSKCPLLEFLTIESCNHPDNTSFEFAGTSLRLKHLHIATAYGITSIKLHNINLLSFELEMAVDKLSINNAPHLARLVLLIVRSVPVIITNTPRLETLFLVQHDEKTCDVPQTYVLNNLKKLVFVARRGMTNLLGVVHVLEACHLLEKLELDMNLVKKKERSCTKSDETKEMLNALPGFPLNNLKEIEIYGFEVYPEKIALATYLLDNAVVLQKMKLYTISRVHCGNGRWEPHSVTTKQATSLQKAHEAKLLEDVHKGLQAIARSSTKVELFSSLSL